MQLNAIAIQHFRSHLGFNCHFSDGSNLILGKNGAGKTNILEAIQVLSTGKTFLSHSLPELVSWGKDFATIQGRLGREDTRKLEVQLYKKPESTTISRIFKVDNIPYTRSKYTGTLKTVVFQPDDLRLITGSPGRRRDFLDDILSSLHWEYASATLDFNKALKHRNELLDLVYKKLASNDQLTFWDIQLIENSKIIASFRQKFLSQANTYFKSSNHNEIHALYINYRESKLNNTIMQQNYETDLRRGSTSSGPHRDDYVFHSSIFKNQNTSIESWASRGQERLAILAFKLAQIDYIKTNFNQSPILLLDDIFSELDPEHRNLVINICSSHQSFITSAEPEVEQLLPKSNIIQL